MSRKPFLICGIASSVLYVAATVIGGLRWEGYSSIPLGRPFKIYSVATLAVLVVFGVWTSLDGPRLAANLPTPWMGVKERVDIFGFMLWVVVLALALWRAAPRTGAPYSGPSP